MSVTVDRQPLSTAGPTTIAMRFFARLWMGWFLFTAVEIVWICYLQHSDSRFRPDPAETGISSPYRDAQWISFEVAAAALWVAVFGIMTAALLALTRLCRLPKRAASRFLIATKILVLWTFLVLVVLSWGAFITNGTFLDRDSIYFSFQLTHPFRMLFWTSPVVVSLLPFVALLIVVGGGWIIRRIERRIGKRWTKILATTGFPLAMGLFLFSTGSDSAARQPPSAGGGNELLGAAHVSSETLWRYRRYRLGPCSTALLDILDLGAIPDVIPPEDKSIALDYRPRISMDDYFQHVNVPAVHRWNVVLVEVESMRADSLRAKARRATSCR